MQYFLLKYPVSTEHAVLLTVSNGVPVRPIERTASTDLCASDNLFCVSVR